MSEANSPAPASPVPENPELVGGTDPLPVAESAPESNVVLENATLESAPSGATEPIVEPAPAEAPQNSPQQGESSEAPQPSIEPPAEKPEAPIEELPAEQPAPLLAAPTPQPPLPGPFAFDEHGKPGTTVQPAEKTARYVDADGVKHDVTVVAERKDGSVDIMMPATVGGYRRDAVRRRQDTAQVGDYLE